MSLSRPGLIGVLEKLTPEQRPALVRGDCGFGNEPFIAELEARAQPYLFKLRQTVGVKKLLTRQFARDDWSTLGPSDQGWSAVEDTLKLSGWDKSCRVVVLRRAVKTDLALSRKTKNEPGEQIELLMPDKDVQAWEYAVLVTSSTYALETFGQLYRDRAGCENGFESCKGCCGAVASDGSMENVPGLRGTENHPPPAALVSAKSARDDRITAGSRFIQKVFLGW